MCFIRVVISTGSVGFSIKRTQDGTRKDEGALMQGSCKLCFLDNYFIGVSWDDGGMYERRPTSDTDLILI